LLSLFQTASAPPGPAGPGAPIANAVLSTGPAGRARMVC